MPVGGGRARAVSLHATSPRHAEGGCRAWQRHLRLHQAPAAWLPQVCFHAPMLVGLLSTEAGTLGRFAGNALLWATGKATGLGEEQLPRFAAVLYASLAAMCAALLAHLACNYRRLKG